MQPLPAARRLPGALPMGVGAVVAGIGVGGIAASASGSPAVSRLPPGVAAVAPEWGAGLVLAGVALLVLGRQEPGRLRLWAGGLLGGLAALVGIFGLVRHSVGIPVLDAMLADAFGPQVENHRLHPSAAVALLLAGLALATLDISAHRPLRWAQALAPAASAIALVTVLAYALQAGVLPGAATTVAMPVSTAGGLLLLSAGIMVARPEQGLLRPYTSAGPGGTVARRLTPSLILLPFGMAVLSAAAVRAGVGQAALAVAMSTGLIVLILVLVVAGTARAVDEVDARQRRVLDELGTERDFTATLVQSLDEGVVVLDRDLRVIEVNARWCRLVGRRREDLVGQRPPYSWQPDGQISPGGAGSDRYIRRADGALVPVLATMAPVLGDNGQPRAYVATYIDISERKRTEDALADRATELEQANAQLVRTNRQLKEAAEFKSDLMAMVSHEVSQPLSSVASLAELLADEWDELSDDIRLQMVNKIDNNTRRLTSMINDMLLLFRLDAGAVSARRASVPVAEVVETVTEALRADTGEIVASIDPELCALVDRGHLWQVLSNLVGNAVRYGEPPVEIAVEQRPDEILLSVRDHGKGIPEEYVPRLFDRFTRRSGAGGNRARGSGLGLFIVRHLVEVNGGTIWYERAEPCGARLVVRLQPAPRPVAAASEG